MGLFGWIYDNFIKSDEEKRREESVRQYQAEMRRHWAEYRPKLKEARERWADSQREAYKQYGTGAGGLGLSEAPSMGGFEEEGGSGISEEDLEEAEEAQEEIMEDQEEIQKDIEAYKEEKEEAIQEFSDPGD